VVILCPYIHDARPHLIKLPELEKECDYSLEYTAGGLGHCTALYTFVHICTADCFARTTILS
jgi:hypothetical protein